MIFGKAINLEYLVGTSFAVRFQENPDLRAWKKLDCLSNSLTRRLLAWVSESGSTVGEVGEVALT